MRISDWSSDVCSSDLSRLDTLSLPMLYTTWFWPRTVLGLTLEGPPESVARDPRVVDGVSVNSIGGGGRDPFAEWRTARFRRERRRRGAQPPSGNQPGRAS